MSAFNKIIKGIQIRDIVLEGEKFLNLGCGKRPLVGCINVDIVKLPGVDIQWDLNKTPWLFEDESFDGVIAEDVLEHLDDIVKAMEEIYRILKKGGNLFIRGPYAKYPLNAWRDPTHKRVFTLESFDYFDPETEHGRKYSFYTKARFKVLMRREYNKGVEFLLTKR